MGMFKFDTQKQLGGARREGVVRRINGVLPWSARAALEFCGHGSFLIRRAFSSLASPPSLFLTLIGRLFLRRVPTLHTMRAPTGLQNLQRKPMPLLSQGSRLYVCGLSVMSLYVCECLSVHVRVLVHVSVCLLGSVHVHVHAHASFCSCCRVCLFVQSCLPSL